MLLWEKQPHVPCLGSRQVENPTPVGTGAEAWLSESQVKASLPGVLSVLAANNGLCP